MEEGPKICFFIEHLGGGGAQGVLLTLARELCDEATKVDLVVARLQGERTGEVDPKVRLVNLDVGVRGPAWILVGTLRFAAYLRREKPRTVLAFAGLANVVAVWARLLAKAKVRVVISVRGFVGGYLDHTSVMKAIVLKWLIRRSYWRADDLIAVSVGVADDIAKLAGISRKRVRVIANPVVDERLNVRAAEPVHHHFFDGDFKVVLGVGRLCREKRFDVLIDALRIVCSVEQNVAAIIVGDGDKRHELEDQIASKGLTGRVDLIGRDSNPIKYMTHADVLVLSSEQEGLPNVLIEALACGCPVVSTNCPFGPAEILGGGRYGRLVPVGDVEALARAVLDTLVRPPNPEVLRERANDFHVRCVVDQYREVLHLAIGGSPVEGSRWRVGAHREAGQASASRERGACACRCSLRTSERVGITEPTSSSAGART